MKIAIVVEVKDQARVKELTAMWAHGLVGNTFAVIHPLAPPGTDVPRQLAGEIEIVDFISAERVEEPTPPRRRTKRDKQERLGASGDQDV